MKFIIDRTIWSRGNHFPKEKTQLLNEQGHMCCLGFVCKQEGVEEKYLQGCSTPETLKHIVGSSRKSITWRREISGSSNSALSQKAMEINDDETITDKEREEPLKKLFKSKRHTIEFIN